VFHSFASNDLHNRKNRTPPIFRRFWFKRYNAGEFLSPGELTSYCVFIGYMTARLWSETVRPRHHSFRRAVLKEGVSTLDRLDLLWTTRSACQAAEILPNIKQVWDGLVSLWGEENARAVCTISVYVTDKDETAVALLKRQIKATSLSGCVQFRRPNFHEIVERHSLEMISTRRNSYTLLAFCGSPALSRAINETKISNDMVLAVTGNKKHQIEFASESYGGVTSPDKKNKTAVVVANNNGKIIDKAAQEKTFRSTHPSIHPSSSSSSMMTAMSSRSGSTAGSDLTGSLALCLDDPQLSDDRDFDRNDGGGDDPEKQQRNRQKRPAPPPPSPPGRKGKGSGRRPQRRDRLDAERTVLQFENFGGRAEEDFMCSLSSSAMFDHHHHHHHHDDDDDDDNNKNGESGSRIEYEFVAD